MEALGFDLFRLYNLKRHPMNSLASAHLGGPCRAPTPSPPSLPPAVLRGRPRLTRPGRHLPPEPLTGQDEAPLQLLWARTDRDTEGVKEGERQVDRRTETRGQAGTIETRGGEGSGDGPGTGRVDTRAAGVVGGAEVPKGPGVRSCGSASGRR